MTHVPPESKAWPRAGARGRPSSSGEQAGRVGQPVRETSQAAREPVPEPGSQRPQAEPTRRPDDAPAGDGSVQEQPRGPGQRTD